MDVTWCRGCLDCCARTRIFSMITLSSVTVKRCVSACACCSLVAFPSSATMTERSEQRYCIKFCQKLGDSHSDTIRKVQEAFGDEAMGVSQIRFWYNRFKNGRASVESDMRSGRPSTSRNPEMAEKVRTLVMGNRRITKANRKRTSHCVWLSTSHFD